MRDLKHKVRRGMKGVIRDGRNAGGRAYGYRPVPGRPGELEIVEHEAEVIRRIFREYISGRVPREIAGSLNAEGVPPPRGARWNASTINGNAERGYGILLNSLYRGRIVWNRVTMVRDPDTGRRISRVNPESEWQSAEATHLAIVDPETWNAVQGRKAAKSHLHAERRDMRPKRPFSGLLRCGVCGGGMALHDRSGSAVRIRCSTAKESGACDNGGRYRLDRIERAIIERLREQLAHPEALRAYLHHYREARRSSIAAATRDRTALEREVATISGQLDRMLGLYTRSVIDGETAERQIADLQASLTAAKGRLAEAATAVPVVEAPP
ncbi:MAG: recombinase family protein [Amaricoccus sp.]|uniref:recombinase family protein n=1 Tax=Amaricoccus sp. TaxID=1872485 RepID=UPI0039E57ABB